MESAVPPSFVSIASGLVWLQAQQLLEHFVPCPQPLQLSQAWFFLFFFFLTSLEH